MPADDCVIAKMTTLNIPMTRENYLAFAYFGTPPDQLSAEEEYMLPEQFQLNPPENFE